MFNRFTERARKVIVYAKEEARRFNHDYIGTEHLLLGLIREGEGVAAAVLQKLGLDLETIRIEVEKLALAHLPELAIRSNLSLVLDITPQVQPRQEIRSRRRESRMVLRSFFPLLRGTFTGILHRESSGDDHHLVETSGVCAFDDHSTEARVDR